MNRILRINMTDRTFVVEPLPDRYRYLGGRAITSQIVADEVPPTCDALGPSNKLVWAPGLLSGTTVSSTSRVSVGCKSPLTGTIKESNAGGETGLLLAQLGYRAVIVEGAAEPGSWWVLVIDWDEVRFVEAPKSLIGAGGYATAAELFAQYGGVRQCGMALIGPAGELKMNVAGIVNTDRDGRASRLNARGGVGAVMGSKSLKAVVVMGNKRNPVSHVDEMRWKEGARQYMRMLREHPATSERYPQLGTAGTLEVVNKLGGLPTRNFSAGRFEAADQIAGIRMREIILERGGEGRTTHSCMTGCAIQCSNIFPDRMGREVASSMEFETNGLWGSNLGIADLDAVARFTYLCNDLGVDTIEAGGTMGIFMEAGLIQWGDASAVEHILDHDLRSGTPLGRLAGSGAGIAGRALGVVRVPVVKNQTISAYDPRAIKGNGVTYCTSPQGADHTAGNTIGMKVDHLDPAGKVALSREVQLVATILDMLGYCTFARGLTDINPETFSTMFNAYMGTTWSWKDLRQLALSVIGTERGFNRRAGFGAAHDRLPEWMRKEPLPPHNAVFDVDNEGLDSIWEC